MPRGGARVGAGAPLGSANRSRSAAQPLVVRERPRFESGRDFALWALNAPDDEAPMAVKVRAMQALTAMETKEADGKAKPAPDTDEDLLYAPRLARPFRAVA